VLWILRGDGCACGGDAIELQVKRGSMPPSLQPPPS